MATTTNYGWTTPNDTDLVKDGAAAIRTLGSSIDTTVFANASAGIPKTIVDAKGDLIAATAADTVSRLGIGANGTILTADSAEATGLKWAAAAGSSLTLSTVASGSLNSGTSLTLSSLSGYDTLILILKGLTWTTGTTRPTVRINGNSGGNYVQTVASNIDTSTSVSTITNSGSTSINLGGGVAQENTSTSNLYICTFTNCKSAGFTNVNFQSIYVNDAIRDVVTWGNNVYKVAESVSNLVISTLNTYTFNGTGTYELIGG
jgi:hypothetical protein